MTALLARFWPAIPIALLAVALLLTRGTLERTKAKLETCNLKQEVNLASIATLTEKVAEQNRAVAELHAAGEARRKAAADAEKRAVEREKASRATIDRLRASGAVRRSEAEPCVISTTLAGTEGL